MHGTHKKQIYFSDFYFRLCNCGCSGNGNPQRPCRKDIEPCRKSGQLIRQAPGAPLSPCLSGPPGTGAQPHALPAWAWAQLRLPPAFEGHFAQTAPRALALRPTRCLPGRAHNCGSRRRSRVTLPERPSGLWRSDSSAACLGLRATAAVADVRGLRCHSA